MRATTFRSLRGKVDFFAGLLQRSGVRPGDRVGILMPNSARWVVAYFSVLVAGAVAVPLEYEFLADAPEDLAFALEHAGCRVAVADPADAGAVRSLDGSVERKVLSVPPEAPPEGVKPPEVEQRRPDDEAQVLYTSGTTGRKKGVVLTHRNLLCNVRQCRQRFGVYPNDSLPALLPYHHAYPLTTTVLLPLYCGALMTVGNVRSKRLKQLLSRSRPTVLVGVPRLYESLLDGIKKMARRRGSLGRLEAAMALSDRVKRWTGLNPGRLIFRKLHGQLFGGSQLKFGISGGARLSTEVVRQYLRLGIPLLQGWGMTEISPVGAVQPYSAWRFYLTRHYERKAGSIGTPVQGADISLVDCPEQGVFVERDGRGEMVVRGPHVMREYLADGLETRRRKGPEGLRTGDIARMDEDGHLWIVGRAKHVIVLPSGKKVFPEDDLYEELAACPGIDEFAVKPICDDQENEKIGLIIKPNSEGLAGRGIETMGELYREIRDEIIRALDHKPHYLKNFDLCLTPLVDGEFQELVKNTVEEPCPARIPFRHAASYDVMKDSTEPICLKSRAPAPGP